MKNLMLFSLMVLSLVGCNQKHPIIISIKDANTAKIEKIFVINSDSLLNVDLDTCNDERTKILLENLSQADRIFFTVTQPMDLFGDNYVSYSAHVSAYKDSSGTLVKYYNTVLSMFCDSNTIESPRKMEFQQNLGGSCFGSEDYINVISTLNPKLKKAITSKAVSFGEIEKWEVTFINENTHDTTDSKGFLGIVKTAAEEKKLLNTAMKIASSDSGYVFMNSTQSNN